MKAVITFTARMLFELQGIKKEATRPVEQQRKEIEALLKDETGATETTVTDYDLQWVEEEGADGV